MVVVFFIIGLIVGALFGGATVIAFLTALGIAIPSAVAGAILGPLVGVALVFATPIGLLLAPLLASVGTGMVLVLIVFIIWMILGLAVTALPYIIAAATVFGPQGARSGLIPEDPWSYNMRGAMTGISLAANAVVLATIAAVCMEIAVTTPSLSAALIALLAVAAIIVGIVTHILSLIPAMSPVPWVRTLIGWSGWFMPLTWPAQVFGLINVVLNLIGRAAGSPYRFFMDWRHGVPVFFGGWAQRAPIFFVGQGWGGFAPGNFVFNNLARWGNPLPIERAEYSRITITRHETGHCLHTSVLGTFFGLLDVIQEVVWPVAGERAYGEMMAESLVRRSPVYWSGNRASIPIPWIGMWGTAANLIPEARITGPVIGTVGSPLMYAGLASSDPDTSPGSILGYRWALYGEDNSSRFDRSLEDALPDGVFDRTDRSVAIFTPDTAGRFALELRTHDGAASSYPARVCVGVDVPIASVSGPNITALGSTVTLNGTASTDFTGVGIDDFEWDLISVPEGCRSVLTSAAMDDSLMTFTPDVPGRYVARLVVSNVNDVESCPLLFSLLCECTQQATAPTAIIAPLGETTIDTAVTLDGSASSDPGGAALSHAWDVLESPPGSLAAPSDTTSMPTFTPDMPGRYLIRLMVNNGTDTSCPAFITLTAHCPAPAIDLVVNRGTNLAARATPPSDARPLSLSVGPIIDTVGTVLTFTWALVARPPGSTLPNPLIGSGTSFMFQPDVPSVHVVRVVATDSNGVVRCRAGWCEDVRPIPALPLAQVHLLNTVALDNDVGHPDRSRIHLGARGYLNAESVNHRNNLPNTFVWRLEQRPPGSNAVLDAPALVDGKGAVFVADRLGRYVVSLRLINSSVATCAEVHVFDAVDR